VSSEVPHVYSYQDVAEAMVVHELIQRGLSLRDIKCAIEMLRHTYGDWPLAEAPIVATDAGDESGRAAAIGLQHPDGGFTDLSPGRRSRIQGMVPVSDLRRVAAQLRRGGWAVRGTDLRSIEVDPDRLSGRPAIRGTRVSAELVAGLASTEAGRRTLRTDYGITAHQMDEALTWWQAVEKLTAAA